MEQIPRLERQVHHRIYWVLSCDHRVNCNCNHTIGGPAYCMICKVNKTVVDVDDVRVMAEKK